MTINGPMRVSDIQREIDGMVKEIGYSGDEGGGGGGGRRFPERYYSESVVCPAVALTPPRREAVEADSPCCSIQMPSTRRRGTSMRSACHGTATDALEW